MPKVNIRRIGRQYHLAWRVRAGTKPDGSPLYRQRSQSASFDLKTAQMLQAQKQIDFDRGQGGLPRAHNMTWSECCARYMSKKADEGMERTDVAANALKDFNSRLTLYSIQEFNPRVINRYAQLLAAAGRKPNGIKRYISVLVNLGAFILREGIMDHNPAAGREHIRGASKPKIKHLNDAEISVFLSRAWDKYLRFGILGLYTGFRPGEILMTGYSDIDFGRGVIRVAEKPRHDWHPKTYEQRTVAIAPELMTHIREWKKTAKHDLVICNDNGSPIQSGSMGSMFRRFLKPVLGIPHLIPYIFRHTFAAKYLYENPESIYELSKILGHRSVKTTQTYYEHLATGYAGRGMNKVSYGPGNPL